MGRRCARAGVVRTLEELRSGAPAQPGLMAGLSALAEDCQKHWGVGCVCHIGAVGIDVDATQTRHLCGLARDAVEYAVHRRHGRVCYAGDQPVGWADLVLRNVALVFLITRSVFSCGLVFCHCLPLHYGHDSEIYKTFSPPLVLGVHAIIGRFDDERLGASRVGRNA